MKGLIPILLLLGVFFASCAPDARFQKARPVTDVGWSEVQGAAQTNQTYECEILPTQAQDTVHYLLTDCATHREVTELAEKTAYYETRVCDTLYGPFYSLKARFLVSKAGTATWVEGTVYAPFHTACTANVKFLPIATNGYDTPAKGAVFWYGDGSKPNMYGIEHDAPLDIPAHIPFP